MPSPFTTDKEKFSCALAMNAAAHLLQLPLELDREIMIDTLTTILRGGSPVMSQEEYRAANAGEKDDTFLGAYFVAAMAQKSMVTGKIFREQAFLPGDQFHDPEGRFAVDDLGDFAG